MQIRVNHHSLLKKIVDMKYVIKIFDDTSTPKLEAIIVDTMQLSFKELGDFFANITSVRLPALQDL